MNGNKSVLKAKSVLVVNIEKGKSESNGLFLPIYGALVEKLKLQTSLHVEIIDAISTLQSKCIEYNPKTTVLLFTNELVTEDTNLANILQNFVKGGALAIFSCLFASYAKPENENDLFASLGLPWKIGSNGTGKFKISPVGRFLLNDCEEHFSAKAYMLTQVLPQQMLYTMEMNAHTQNALLSEGIDNSFASTTMAAFAKVGKGAVSYIGNHNIEDGFIRLIIALCSV